MNSIKLAKEKVKASLLKKMLNFGSELLEMVSRLVKVISIIA